jgi:hypothetical protein
MFKTQWKKYQYKREIKKILNVKKLYNPKEYTVSDLNLIFNWFSNKDKSIKLLFSIINIPYDLYENEKYDTLFTEYNIPLNILAFDGYDASSYSLKYNYKKLFVTTSNGLEKITLKTLKENVSIEELSKSFSLEELLYSFDFSFKELEDDLISFPYLLVNETMEEQKSKDFCSSDTNNDLIYKVLNDEKTNLKKYLNTNINYYRLNPIELDEKFPLTDVFIIKYIKQGLPLQYLVNSCKITFDELNSIFKIPFNTMLNNFMETGTVNGISNSNNFDSIFNSTKINDIIEDKILQKTSNIINISLINIELLFEYFDDFIDFVYLLKNYRKLLLSSQKITIEDIYDKITDKQEILNLSNDEKFKLMIDLNQEKIELMKI